MSFAKSSPCSNNHLPLTLPACLPLLGFPSALTVNFHPFHCFYPALWSALLLSGSNSFFSLPWLSAPWFLVLLQAPSCLTCFSQVPFSLAHFLTSSSCQRCEMLRNGGRVRTRNVRRVGMWCNEVCLCLFPPLPLSQCIFSPPYSCTYDCNIIYMSNKWAWLLVNIHLTYAQLTGTVNWKVLRK